MADILEQIAEHNRVIYLDRKLEVSLSEMKDMSDEMAIYRKVTNATAEDMERIRAQAYATAKQYGKSASDVIASAANIA